MAFCGVKFVDEAKEKVKVMGHTLKNVGSLSASQKQETTSSKEGLLISDKYMLVDRRTKIDFGDKSYQLRSYVALCQMKVQLRPGIEAVGSCSRIRLNGDDYVFTCAHNLVTWDNLHDRGVNVQKGFVYTMRQGEDCWTKLHEIQVNRILVHPNYEGEPYSGFDFAVAPIVLKEHENSKYKGFISKNDINWGGVKPESIEVGLNIEVAGFPGDKKGYSYVHSGKIVAKKKTKAGGWVIYYDVDTTPGNSGSDVNVIDKAWVQKYGRPGFTKWTIGVHTGHCHAAGLNYGTLITPAIYKWFELKTKKNIYRVMCAI